MVFSSMIYHSVKVLYSTVLFLHSNLRVSRVLAIVMEMSAKTCGLASS